MHPLLHFDLHGDGPEHVLVLHDWNGDSTNYDPMRTYLDASRFTYAFVDLRGYGGSRQLRGAYDVGEISADCRNVADALGWERFHVIGHSMTGMATQRIALDAPGRVRSAVAICPISAAGSKLDSATREFFASTTHDDGRFIALLRYMSGGLSARWEAVKLRQCRERVDPACRDGYLRMLVSTDFAAEVRGLPTPWLVVIGQHDQGLGRETMQDTFLAWHPRARLVELAGVGHYPMQECPPRLATVIEEFFRGLSE